MSTLLVSVFIIADSLWFRIRGIDCGASLTPLSQTGSLALTALVRVRNYRND
jgi:hypothetical protein